MQTAIDPHHARLRTTERLRDAGLDLDIIQRIYQAAEALASASPPPSEAIRLLVLDRQVNELYGTRSNGNELWAIIRNRRLVTVMLRCDNQAKTRAALRVEKVTVLPG